MLRAVISACRYIGKFFVVLFTGGKYGPAVPSEHSYKYSKSQEQKRKDFREFGGRACKICSARIPGNKSYCGPCFFKYVKK